MTCDSNRRFIRVLLLAEENLLLWDIKYWLYVISVWKMPFCLSVKLYRTGTPVPDQRGELYSLWHLLQNMSLCRNQKVIIMRSNCEMILWKHA